MKKINLHSKIPLYVADALMFAAVIAICWNNIIFGEVLGTVHVLACCAMVACGMALVALPLFFEHRERMLKIKSGADSQKAALDENFKIIFEDLQAIRVICADTDERIENDEYAIEKLALKINKDSPLMQSLSSLETRISELADSLSSNAESLSKAELAGKENFEKIENILKEIGEFKNSVETRLGEFEKNSKEQEKTINENSSTEFFEKFESLSAAVSEMRENSLEKFAEIFALIAALPQKIETDEVEENATPTPSIQAESGMLSRALSNGAMAKNAVKKFINKDADNSASDALEEDEIAEGAPEDGEDNSESKEEIFEEETSFESGEEENTLEEETSIFDEGEEDDFSEGEILEEEDFEEEEEAEEELDEFDAEDSEAPENAPPDGMGSIENDDDNADFFKQTGSEEKGISESGKHNVELFDNIPESHKSPRKAKKGDTLVIVNSLIGIGNKPFLRGQGGGLSADKGLPMDFLEIGKWSWVAPSGGNLKFRVLKNDKIPTSEDLEYELEAGKTIELNLIF